MLRKKIEIILFSSFSSLFLIGCGEGGESLNKSGLGDIFLEDESNPERRHKATNEERLWTVDSNGCSASLLSPEYLISANHCGLKVGSKFTSGYCLNNGCTNDITATESLDKDQRMDYHILKISWKDGSMPEGQKFPPSILIDDSKISAGKKIGEGAEVFTVGFPADKVKSWGATFAKGRIKDKETNDLVYNIGIINGNSGGAVWRIKDKMLVALTNWGPHGHGDPGWDKNKLDDSSAWNGGTNMAAAYKHSKVLKKLFPDGKNIHHPDNQ